MKCLIFIILFSLYSKIGLCDHIISDFISYKLIDSNTRKYKISFLESRECSYLIGPKPQNGSAAYRINVKSIGCNAFKKGTSNLAGPFVTYQVDFIDATAKCNSNSISSCSPPFYNSPIVGNGIRLLEGEFSFPKECDEFIIYKEESARNAANTSFNYGVSLYSESFISFKDGMFNNSADFNSLNVMPTYCINQNGTYSIACLDIDGDSLVYELESAQGLNASPLTYVLGSPSHPTMDCGYFFDPINAVYKFRPSMIQNSTLCFRVKEFRNGKLVGSTKRDIQLLVGNSATCHDLRMNSINTSSCSISNTSQINIDNFGCYKDTFPIYKMVFCENSPINFQVKLLNRQKGITNYDGMTGSAGLILDLDTNNRDSIRDFQYTFSNPKAGIYNVGLNVNYCQDTGLYNIKFVNAVNFQYRVLRSPRPSKDTLFYCTAGGAVDVSIDRLDSGVTFDWSHHTGFVYSNFDSSKVKIALTHDTTYYIHYKYYGTSCPSCNMIDTIVVKFVPDFTYTTGLKNKIICINQSHQLSVNSSISGSPYIYKWSPIKDLYHPITGIKLDSASVTSIGNPILKPSRSNNLIQIDIISKTGCTIRDTFQVNAIDSIPHIKAVANRFSFCQCDTTQLKAVNLFPTCGKAEYPNLGLYSYVNIGSGAKTFPKALDTSYPSLTGRTYAEVKHRILIKQSELTALGLTNKNIREIFIQPFSNTGNIQESALYNIDVSFACTQIDTVTQSITTIPMAHLDSLLLYPQWMSIPLNNFGFNISNGSNLIIEFSFRNDTNTAFGNTRFYVDSLPFHSTAWVVGPGAKTSTNWTGISTIRPMLRFYAGDLRQATASNYEWTPTSPLNNANIQNPIANLCASQQFVVTAKQGVCEAKDSITIYVDTAYSIQARSDTFICSNLPVQLNATIIGSPLPGNSFKYYWRSIPQDTSLLDSTIINPIVTPAQTTTYILKMSGGACDKYDTVKITRGAPLNLSMSKKDPTCSGANGRAVVKTNNGNGPFTYTWNPSNINDDTIKNILAGKYKVTVQAADGCLGNDSITLNNIFQTPSLILTKQNVRCFNEANGSVKVKVNSAETGPFQYTWIPANANKDSIFNLAAGWYSVTVLDTPSNCTARDSILITQPNKLSIDADSVDVLCNGNNTGSLSTNTTGGTPTYTYAWSDISIGNNASASNKTAGNYTVTVVDSKGCRDSNTTSINQPIKLTGSMVNKEDVNCYGDSNGIALIDVIGGTKPYLYNWGNSTNETDSAVNTLKKGIHQVIITDKNNCLDTVKNISIAQPDTIHIQINAYPAKCFGQNNGSAKASITGGNGGYAFLWSEGNNTDSISSKTAGTYSLTVTDIKGCNKQASTIIYQSDSLTSKNNQADSVRCAGEQNGKAIVHILGGKRPYAYTWNTSPIQTDSIAINLSANNYSVTSTDANGCKKIDTITISEPSKLQIDSIKIDTIDCESINGGRIEIRASGGNTGVQYSIGPFFQNSAIFSNIDRGIYTATARDYKGCQDTKVFTILQGKPLQINLKTIDAACIGIDNGRAWIESITGGLSPFTVTWSNGQNTDTIQNIQGKQWIKIQIIDALNCQRTDSIYIGIQSNIIIQSTTKNITCYGGGDGVIEVRASGGKSPYSYQWFNNTQDSIIKNLSAETPYSLTVQDALGCVDTMSFSLKQPQPFNFDSISYQAVTCPDAKDGLIEVTVKGGSVSNAKPYQFSMDSVRWQTNRIFRKLSGGVYTLYAMDGNGCKTKTTAKLEEPPRITLTVLPKDTIIKIGYPVQMESRINSKDTIKQYSFKYQWIPTEGMDCSDCASPVSKPNQSTTYTLKLDYNDGCKYEGKAFIDIKDGIFIPTAFSPNQRDAMENETFKVYGENIQNTHIQIYNRWNEKVYEESSAKANWNGYYRSDLAAQGVYSYHITITFIGGKVVEKHGEVMLFR